MEWLFNISVGGGGRSKTAEVEFCWLLFHFDVFQIWVCGLYFFSYQLSSISILLNIGCCIFKQKYWASDVWQNVLILTRKCLIHVTTQTRYLSVILKFCKHIFARMYTEKRLVKQTKIAKIRRFLSPNQPLHNCNV